MTSALEHSEALHARVRALAAGEGSDSFDSLAWELACFQRGANPTAKRLWGHGPFASPETRYGQLWQIPALPVEALRFVDVFAFATSEARHTFETSGTTSRDTGRHRLRTTATYEALLLSTARESLWPSSRSAIVVSLLPFTGTASRSSLAFMAQRLMQHLDGCGLTPERAPAAFGLGDPDRWLWSARGVDLDGVRRIVRLAHDTAEPVLLLTTSFALLGLVEALGGERLPLPEGSVVMPTGGFKGKSREVDPVWLRERTEALLRPGAIVHEYGMTELSSQLYERTHPSLGAPSEPFVYFEAKTLRVIPVHPVTLLPVADGEVGLASFVDLGNVDSAVRILTQDRVKREGQGIRLLGRSPAAPLRGCSLLAESLVSVRPRKPPRVTVLEPTGAPGDALERIRPLLSAACILRDARSFEGRRLREQLARGGLLSHKGIELALERCLDSDPGEAELTELVHSVPAARRVWINLSANVFVAALRAIALGLAACKDVRVRPSRRDATLARALAALAPGSFRLVDELNPVPGDHVYAYGSDETLASLRAELPGGVVWHAHGEGIGVGWVAHHEPGAARGLALDVSLFDQRGCASPRVVALGPGVDVGAYIRELAVALADLQREIPLGTLSEAEQAAVSHFRALARVCADPVLEAAGSTIAVQLEPGRVLLPPIGRHLSIVAGPSALERLGEAEPSVTTIAVAGGDEAKETARRLFPRARHCAFGEMQTPRFDGPLDRRNEPGGERIP